MTYSRDLIQASTTIAKTTETLMGSEIACKGYDTLTLYLEYGKGDETGLNIYPYVLHKTGGTEFQDASWTAAPGTKAVTTNIFQMTASGDHIIVFDIRGIEIIKFYQGGSNNDGTPNGTIVANISMSGE